MTAVREEPRDLPPGRYGADTDARADRRLRQVGAVLGAVVLVLVGWYGWAKMTATTVSGEVISFRVVSDRAVVARLEIRKDAGVTGVCTLRSQSADQTEVGRRDVRFAQRSGKIDTDVTIRTTARGTTAELLGCHAGSGR
jgi:uncharacterized protein DUF4307